MIKTVSPIANNCEKTMNKIPNISDWSGYESDFDSKEAFKNFFGKSNEQMRRNYRENISILATDLRFMPTTPFRYYVIGFKDFLCNEPLDDFSKGEAASSLFRIVEYKAEHQPTDILPVIEDLLSTLEDIAGNQEKYDLSISICGDYSEKLSRIKYLLGLKP